MQHETYSSVGKLLHKLLISLTQPTFLPLTFWSLSETFIIRSMINSSSGSCHNSDATWQEIGSKRQYIFEGGTTILEPGRGQLHAEPHVRPISCHVASLSWQEPEEELSYFF